LQKKQAKKRCPPFPPKTVLVKWGREVGKMVVTEMDTGNRVLPNNERGVADPTTE